MAQDFERFEQGRLQSASLPGGLLYDRLEQAPLYVIDDHGLKQPLAALQFCQGEGGQFFEFNSQTFSVTFGAKDDGRKGLEKEWLQQP